MPGAGTDKTKRWIEQPAPVVVLVEPQMGENIGAAITRAFSLGQPCTGLTSRKRDRPKLAMARAAAPMFSPICGSTRTTTGAGCSIQRLVLSVPAPGILVLRARGIAVQEERGKRA